MAAESLRSLAAALVQTPHFCAALRGNLRRMPEPRNVASLPVSVDARSQASPKPRRKRKRGEVRLRAAGSLLHEPVDWNPLLELVGVGLTQRFMDMGRTKLEDGTVLHAYKHRDTRGVVHLAADGRAFHFDAQTASVGAPYEFVEMTRTHALMHVLGDVRVGATEDDQRRNWMLVDRALDYASEGLRVPVDARYVAAYARAVAMWEEVSQLADEIARVEYEDARERELGLHAGVDADARI